MTGKTMQNRFKNRSSPGFLAVWPGLALALMLAFSFVCGRVRTPAYADEIVSDAEDDGDTVVVADSGKDSASVQDTESGDVGDLSGLFSDTGEDIVQREGETLEEAREQDDPRYGSGDGGSTVNIGHLYEINGVMVRNSDFSSEHYACWTYANNVYAKIWGHNFLNVFNDTENMLRNLPDEDLTLTPEHLKAYVSAAPAGAVLRVCDAQYLHADDGWGHSQIIISHDENGFTVFEGGLAAWPHRREAYYTWTGYCYSGWPGKYHYIKYIKWPGAGTWTAGSRGSNATDLGVIQEEKDSSIPSELKEAIIDLADLFGSVISGDADPEELETVRNLLKQVQQEE